MNKKQSPPKIILIIAWVWIIGAVWKIAMTPFSWPEFELWRNLFLFTTKSLFLISGILLFRGYRQAAIIYFAISIVNTLVFYTNLPNINGIEQYTSTQAIALAIVAPLLFMTVILYNWKSLKWK
jgi:hypothetical protein